MFSASVPYSLLLVLLIVWMITPTSALAATDGVAAHLGPADVDLSVTAALATEPLLYVLGLL